MTDEGSTVRNDALDQNCAVTACPAMAKDFQPCDLPRGKDGDAAAYFAKTTGFGYNDMISLPTLTKEAILDNLKKRFKSELVYTYVGDIVISVNPFKNVGNTGKAIRNKYKGGSRTALPPHIYARAP